MNKEIAQRLRILADNYPPAPEVRCIDGKPIYKAEVILKLDGLTIKCLPFKECVLKVAAKYQKARAYSTRGVSCNRPTKRKPKFSWRVVKDFLSEPYGLENAINYMQLHDKPVYFYRLNKKPELLLDVVKVNNDFAETKKNGVYHTLSGINCGDVYKTINSLCQRIYDAVSELSEDDLKFLERARTEHGCA